jgi:deoxyribonuclease V
VKNLRRKIFENSKLNTLKMKSLHSWNVSIEEAIRIQEDLRNRVILEKTFTPLESSVACPVQSSASIGACSGDVVDSTLRGDKIPFGEPSLWKGRDFLTGFTELRSVGGADVAYSKDGNFLFGAIVVLSFPKMELLETATAHKEVSFPYIPGLLSFREAPILMETFKKLKVKPEVMIYDGQGIAHPRGIGLATHMGLWLDLPSIGCTKNPLLNDFKWPRPSKGSCESIRRDGKEVGAVLRTKDRVKPIFISPGHRIDLQTSIQIILATCPKFRIPEPLRRAHQASCLLASNK